MGVKGMGAPAGVRAAGESGGRDGGRARGWVSVKGMGAPAGVRAAGECGGRYAVPPGDLIAFGGSAGESSPLPM